LQKKCPGGEPGLFVALRAFLRGVLEKRGATWWLFVVLIVVDCVVVWSLSGHIFEGERYATVLLFIFGR
jgi:hypothetical protein